MATITLSGNTNYSALTVANNDTIALAGFALTLDAAPTQTGVTVTAAGNAGTVVIGTPSSYTFTGWAFQAGTAQMIVSVASGKSITGGTFIGGSASNATAIGSNSGTMTGVTLVGGSSNAFAVNTNAGLLTGATITGGSGANGSAINQNTGAITVSTLTAGTATNAHAVATNNGVIANSTISGSATASAHGINTCNGPLVNCNLTGGTSATSYAVNTLQGGLFNLSRGTLTDSTGKAVNAIGNTHCPAIVLRGQSTLAAIPTGVQTVYRFGPLASTGSVAGSPASVELYDTPGNLTLNAFGNLDPLRLPRDWSSSPTPIRLYVTDPSGNGVSGLTSATSGLVLDYSTNDGLSWTTITKVAGTLGTYTSGGIVAGATTAGDYWLGLPVAALPEGGRCLVRWAYNGVTRVGEIRADLAPTMLTATRAGYIDTTVSSRHASGAAVASVSGNVGGSVASVTNPVSVVDSTIPTPPTAFTGGGASLALGSLTTLSPVIYGTDVTRQAFAGGKASGVTIPAGNTWSLTVWLKPTAGGLKVAFGNTGTGTFWGGLSNSKFAFSLGTVGVQEASTAAAIDAWSKVRLVCQGTGPDTGMKWYINDVLAGSTPTTATAAGIAGTTLCIGGFDANDNYNWPGLIDDLAVWSTAITSTPTAVLGNESGLLRAYNFDGNLSDAVASLAVDTPVVTALSSTSVTLKAYAKGVGPLSYQWHRSATPGFVAGSGTAIPGATSDTLTDTPPAETWWYDRCVVTDANAQTLASYQRPVKLGVTTAISTPTLTDLPVASVRLIAIGDSTSAADAWDDNIAPVQRAAGWLTSNTPMVVTWANYAVSGTSAAQWAADTWRITDLITAEGGTLAGKYVLLRLGMNDAQNGADANAFAASMVAIVNRLKTAGAKVVVSYPTHREAGSHWPTSPTVGFDESTTPLLLAYQAKIDALVDGVDVFAGDRVGYGITAAFAPTLLYDRIHENGAGATVMGRAEAAAVIRAITRQVQLTDDYNAAKTAAPASAVAALDEKADQILEGQGEGAIDPTEIANAVWASERRDLTDGKIVQQPSTQSRQREIVKGDTYDADNRQLIAQASDGGQWPATLDGRTWYCRLTKIAANRQTGTSTLTTPCTVLSPSGPTQSLRIDLSGEQTTALANGQYDYAVYGEDGNGDVWTVERGRVTAIEAAGVTA